jgi:hypothetical protein
MPIHGFKFPHTFFFEVLNHRFDRSDVNSNRPIGIDQQKHTQKEANHRFVFQYISGKANFRAKPRHGKKPQRAGRQLFVKMLETCVRRYID